MKITERNSRPLLLCTRGCWGKVPSEQWRTDTTREEARLKRGRLTIDEFGFLNGCPSPGGEGGKWAHLADRPYRLSRVGVEAT